MKFDKKGNENDNEAEEQYSYNEGFISQMYDIFIGGKETNVYQFAQTIDRLKLRFEDDLLQRIVNKKLEVDFDYAKGFELNELGKNIGVKRFINDTHETFTNRIKGKFTNDDFGGTSGSIKNAIYYFIGSGNIAFDEIEITDREAEEPFIYDMFIIEDEDKKYICDDDEALSCEITSGALYVGDMNIGNQELNITLNFSASVSSDNRNDLLYWEEEGHISELDEIIQFVLPAGIKYRLYLDTV